MIWPLIFLTASASLPLFRAEPAHECPAMREPGVKYFDIRLPQLEVPEDLTTYVCQNQDLPVDLTESYHAVGFEPIIDNANVMHHMILFGCLNPSSDDDPTKEPHLCSGADNICRTFLMQWSMGVNGTICSPPNAGVRFGLGSILTMALQIHWNNAKHVAGMTDTSGVRVYYTTKLRQHDLGNVQVGQDDLMIPPGQVHYRQSGSCSSDCTNKWLKEPIYLSRAHIHMHYTGDGGILEIVRANGSVTPVFTDNIYDYNSPPAHRITPPVKVNPGDSIKVTCFFNTRDGVKRREKTLYWGEGSDGEMCYAFISYYPKLQSFDQCIQFGKFDICAPTGAPAYGDCAFEPFARVFDQAAGNDVLTYCQEQDGLKGQGRLAALCSLDCGKVIQRITGHPCMQDQLGEFARQKYLPYVSTWPKVSVILDQANRECRG